MISDKQKIQMYEKLLHHIQMYAEVVLDNNKMGQLIGNICNWSYAHRSGNGQLTEEEQSQRVDAAFQKLLDVK